MPSTVGMAVSMLRLTIVLGLLAFILTCQAGKCSSMQLMQCVVVSQEWREVVALIQSIKGKERKGALGSAERALDQGPRGRSSKNKGFLV